MLAGRTILVTGCASGIGRETAGTIRRLGGRVVGVDRNEATGIVDDFVRGDLSTREGVDALVAALPHGLNGLANIAGLPPTAPAAEVVAVNLVGLKYFTEQMIDRLADGAAIVNLASLAGFGWPQAVGQIRAAAELDFDGIDAFIAAHGITNEGGRSYFFTKEALVVWTMQNRWTWRDRGIRMNAVSPGPVETPILPDFMKTLGERAAENRRVMDRPGRPDDIAPVVAFLMSDMAKWIRGANIPVDGGMSAHFLCGMHGL
ncbi:MAG: SDR family oxidoreductase [Alphaproteobacteria bacterium]|nr:MAG: SDR family oxidoreductase [Alphaproteobacteria bacterium]